MKGRVHGILPPTTSSGMNFLVSRVRQFAADVFSSARRGSNASIGTMSMGMSRRGSLASSATNSSFRRGAIGGPPFHPSTEGGGSTIRGPYDAEAIEEEGSDANPFENNEFTGSQPDAVGIAVDVGRAMSARR